MGKRRLLVYLALFAGGLLFISVAYLAPAPRNLHVQVQFLGLTNTPTGSTLAMFRLTNDGDARVRVEPGRDVVLPQRQYNQRRFVPPAQFLSVGQSLVTAITDPPNEPWQARFFFNVPNRLRDARNWIARRASYRLLRPDFQIHGGSSTSTLIQPAQGPAQTEAGSMDLPR